MGVIWIRELKAGLDTRRLPVTSPGGVLIEAVNGHISRGGEFEQRAAFVPAYTLPANTTGLVATRDRLIVFGSGPMPSGLPAGITYQRLQHPGGLPLVRVLSEDLYASKVYAVGQFSDDSIFHFYDGVLVPDWFDGKARASFRVVDGSTSPATKATGSFQITNGTNSPGTNRIPAVVVDGVTITGGSVDHTGSNNTTATAVAASINGFTSTPDYTAAASGAVVTITAAVTGPAANGKLVNPQTAGNVSVLNVQNMSGGEDEMIARLEDLKINGVSIINGPVAWTTSNTATATVVANAIDAFVSPPDYTADSAGDLVSIVAVTPGTMTNGYGVTFVVSGGFAIEAQGSSTSPTLTMQGGVDSDTGFIPGAFVRTVGSKMYSTSGSNLHFSGIQAPTKWQTNTVGAGFIDMASETSGAENLTALARYQNYVAVFAEDVIIIEYVDPDPELNKQAQVLVNTGTRSPRSVTQFGDTDIFYLNESGLRSLRARDSSNAAATEDIGIPVDTLISLAIQDLSTAERRQIIGIIEPRDGRFWLAIKDQIFVFSYFPGSETSAWSIYRPSWQGVEFEVENMVSQNRRLFVRSGNTIYAYGGLGAALQYDDTPAIARIPYLNGDTPTKEKNFTGVDAALDGVWEVYLGMDPNNLDALDKVAVFDQTTFDQGRIGALGNATHMSLRMVSKGVGPHKIGSLVVHFESADGED